MQGSLWSVLAGWPVLVPLFKKRKKKSSCLPFFLSKSCPMLVNISTRIGLCFSLDIFPLRLTFLLQITYLFFLMLGFTSLPPILFLLYLLFLVSCSLFSTISNNILQIFVRHWLRIMNDMHSFHSTNALCCLEIVLLPSLFFYLFFFWTFDPSRNFPISKTEKGTTVFI